MERLRRHCLDADVPIQVDAAAPGGDPEMTGAEREKWNAIHARPADTPGAPSRVLTDHAHLLPPAGLALDLACGAGCNALFLASRGLKTSAWDISAVALQKLRDAAERLALTVHAEERDAIAEPPGPDTCDVIVVCHFLDRSLAPHLCTALRRNGLLFYQTFTVETNGAGGPRNPAYRLGPNELLAMFAGLHLITYREEGTVGNLQEGFRNEALLVAQRRTG